MNLSKLKIFVVSISFLFLWHYGGTGHSFAAGSPSQKMTSNPEEKASGMIVPTAWSSSAGIDGTLPITDMVCPSTKVCFARSVNQVFKTTDSGKTFYTVYKETKIDSALLSARPALWFVDSETGFAGIPGHEYTGVQTRDGGKTWKKLKTEELTGQFGFFDEIRGISGTQTGLMFSLNGGKSWKKGEVFKDKEGKEPLLLSNFFYSKPSLIRGSKHSLTGFIAAFQTDSASSYLLKTEDGGKHWKISDANLPQNLRSLLFKDRDHGWIGTADGHILRTTDGGGSWKNIPVSPAEIRQINCPNINSCFAISPVLIYTTKDGGINWSQLQPVDITQPIVMETIHFTDLDHGIIGGGLAETKGRSNQSILMYTETGGNLTLKR